MDGFLNILKPRGATSHDVVMLARRFLGEDRLGHLGTLDPLAVGVLPMACGTYRRLSEYFLGEDKRYFTEFTFGVRTATGDTEGEPEAVVDASVITPDLVLRALPELRGAIMQKPPSFSALKVRGKKLLDLAREGTMVEAEPREVVVHELNLVGWRPGVHPKGLFAMRVGRGTYVRSLAFSLGDILGCGATVSYLLRERAGKFQLRDSLTVQSLKRMVKGGRAREALMPPLSVMPDYPALFLRPGAEERVSHGVAVRSQDLEPHDTERLLPYRAIIVMPDRREIAAVVSVREGGLYVYEKVLIAK
ncbi:MAG: tRNA pseudouridine(55) synthase TruB [Bacillota bacterium]